MKVFSFLAALAFVGFCLGCGGEPASTSQTKQLDYQSDADAALRLEAIALTSLKDKDALAGRGAAKALGNFGPKAKADIPALTQSLNDEDKLARCAAALALWKIGVDLKAVMPTLIELLMDGNEDVRCVAIDALVSIGPKAKAGIARWVGRR